MSQYEQIQTIYIKKSIKYNKYLKKKKLHRIIFHSEIINKLINYSFQEHKSYLYRIFVFFIILFFFYYSLHPHFSYYFSFSFIVSPFFFVLFFFFINFSSYQFFLLCLFVSIPLPVFLRSIVYRSFISKVLYSSFYINLMFISIYSSYNNNYLVYLLFLNTM